MEKASGKPKSNEKTEKYKQEFLSAINDDLNTSQALAISWEVLRDQELDAPLKLDLILDFDQVFGLNLENLSTEEEVPAHILELLEQRQKARKEKNWAESDRLRDEIKSQGYEILDTREGARAKKIQ